MRKQFIIFLLGCLVLFGLVVSCKNEVPNAGFGEELVSISFREDMARGLTATLEGFDKDHLYWAYAAKKADGSKLISGETDSYDEAGAVWVKTDGYNKPVEGLGTGSGTAYKAYNVSGFSQGYWNFKLYAYKGVLGDNPDTTEVETDYVTGYVLVYQGETQNVLLKSDAVNTQGSHMVSVTVDPVQSEGNGTMVFLTNKMHAAADRISMNTVNSAIYGEHYTVKVLSVQSMEEIPTEYVGTAAEKEVATDSQDGRFSLPAGSYKVTVAFTDSASAPTLNYARGTIVATVYSNLTTTISGDLTEAMTYAEFDGILNPELETVIASKDDIVIVNPLEIQTVILKTDTSAAKEVTATIKTTDTNSIINNMAEAAGTSTGGYDQTLELTLSVETVETTATTATYEIGMTAELTSSKTGADTVVTTSDVSEVKQYVTVEVQLETGLTSVNVLHDGKQMIPGLDSADPYKVGTFAYNGTTGVLTIKTMSFSPFEVSFVKPAETSYVAQVGKVKYQSLAAAISAAKTDGTDTITLLNDVSLTSETDISKKVVLDLAGYRITAAAGLTAYVAETEIRNGNIDAALTISGTGVKLSAVAVKGSVAVSGNAEFDADCSVTGTGEYAVNVTGSITIDGGTYTAAKDKCILSGKAIISDGNFNGSLAPTDATGIVLKGGTYTEMQATSRLASGFECAKISDSVYMVRNIVEAVNVRTGVEYHYLQNAIDAASAGDTVKLLRDVTPDGTITVGDGVSITFDLAGLSLVGNVDGKFVNVLSGGTLVITDSSEGKTGRLYNTSTLNQGSDAVCCAEGGTLTIKAGNFGSSTTQRGASVRNFGTTVIDGGTFTSIKNNLISGAYAYSIINGGAGSLTLNSGEIYGDGQNGGIAINSGSVEINDFKVNDNSAHTAGFASYGVWVTNDDSNGTSVIINDGYFKGNTNGLYGAVDDKKQDKGDVGIIVNGGTFIGGSSAVISKTGSEHNWNLVLYGGLYSSDPSTYVAEGYEAVYDEVIKLWKVSMIEAVQIMPSGKIYGTFKSAYDAAVSGDTMYILQDLTASGHYDFSDKDITIHVNEDVTLECGDVTNGKFDIGFDNVGKLTLEGTGTITFNSNNTRGLITQNGSDSNINATVRNITIEAISGNGYVMAGGNLTVESGYYKSITFDNGAVINGGTFTNVSFSGVTGTPTEIIITGGVFDVDPTEYTAHGYYPRYEDGLWTVIPVPAEEATKAARIGNDFYETLSEAIADVEESETIVLMNNTNESVVIHGKDSIVLNLNRYSLSGTSAYAIKVYDCDGFSVKNGTLSGTNGTVTLGEHQQTTVKWQENNYDSYFAVSGYHPLAPATNVLLENVTAVATSGCAVLFTNIDDLSAYESFEIYGRYIYKNGYQSKEDWLTQNYAVVYTECSDKDSVIIDGGSYTGTTTAFGKSFRKITKDMVTVKNGATFSSDEVSSFIGEGNYLVCTSKDESALVEVAPTEYVAKLNGSVFYTYAGGSNDALLRASCGDTVYIRENADVEIKLGKDSELSVVSEVDGVKWTGARAFKGYEVVETQDSENPSLFIYTSKFDPVAAVYVCNDTRTFTVAKANKGDYTLFGEYATLEEAFSSIKGRGYAVVLLKNYVLDAKTGNYKLSGYGVYNANGGICFDLNGHCYTYNGVGVAVETSCKNGSSNAEFIIQDSSQEKTGTIHATQGYCFLKGNQNTEWVRIKSGTFISDKQSAIYMYQGNHIEIDGGKYISKNIDVTVDSDMEASGTCYINGGTFSSDLSGRDKTKFVVTKSIVDNGDGTWTVGP